MRVKITVLSDALPTVHPAYELEWHIPGLRQHSEPDSVTLLVIRPWTSYLSLSLSIICISGKDKYIKKT